MANQDEDDTPRDEGRPTKYKEEYTEQGYNYALLGATDEDLARFFDVCIATIDNWKNKHTEFLGALKKGKDEADATVANSLFNRAKGYSHPDTKFATFEGMITDSKEYTKHYAPDPTACIFWLKNRQKEKWRDKQEIDSNVTTTINYADKAKEMSSEDLLAVKAIYSKYDEAE